jgi:hypothetical protein
MISLIIVLFFGLTGITLNHPNWTLGSNGSHSKYTGTLPTGSSAAGTVDFFTITEFIRSKYGVTAAVSDHRADDSQGSIAFKGPGYAADLSFDVTTGAYKLSINEAGLLAAMNDVHKGRDTGSGWKWVIDVAGGLLVVVALTGLGIQLFLRKRRRRALTTAAVLGVVTILLIYSTLN